MNSTTHPLEENTAPINEDVVHANENAIPIQNSDVHINQMCELQPIDDIKPLSLGEEPTQPILGLQAYLAMVVVCNFALLFFKGYAADLGYWQDWIGQLSTRGYDQFNGNYPPFYVHWLYVVGKFYTALGIPIEANYLLKFVTQFPVTVSHLMLTCLVYRLLQTYEAPRPFAHSLLLLCVFSPAILINGPVWGQVDLIPVTLLVLAFMLSVDRRYCIFSIPFFTLALLTKFQMIAFAPVFGFIFFRHTTKHFIGILIAIIVAGLVFMPSILAGHLWQAVRQAYIDTLGQYPMTTFNAANIWILLTSNVAPDHISLFKLSEETLANNPLLAKMVTAKYVGMILFSSVALVVFVHGLYFQIKHIGMPHYQQRLSYIFLSATVCAVAFFVLLPAMHERYLFPAVVLALTFSAVKQAGIIFPLALSIVSAINMLIILEINGSNIWWGLSWVVVFLLIYSLLELVSSQRLSNLLKFCSHYLLQKWYFFPVFFILSITIMFDQLYITQQPQSLTLKENQRFLTEFPLLYAKQDFGTMAVGRSNDGNKLSLAGHYYAQGIGTHADSDIQYELPSNAIEFSFMAGLDDETGTADVRFSVWGDDKLLWQSEIMYGIETKIKPVTVDVRGVRLLNLKVDSIKEDKWDHADWVNTVVTLDNNQADPPTH
jgi:Gpi18-like mannosyltransferase